MRRPDRKSSRWLILTVGLLLSACGTKDVPTLLAQARADLAAGKYGEAFIALKNAAQAQPDNPEVRVMLARIGMAQGNPQAADVEISRVPLDKIPDAAGQLVKFQVDLAMGRTDAVLAALDSSKLAAEDKSYLRALVHRRHGEHAQALELLTPIAAAHPARVDFATELVSTLATLGDSDAAQKQLEAFLAANPKDPELLVTRARLELTAGRVQPAIQALDSALASTDPAWPPARRAYANFLLGDTALRLRQVAKAKTALENLGKVAPGMVGATLLKARIALAEDRPADAIGDLQAVMRAAPGETAVPLLLAEAHLQTRNIVQAQAVLEQVLAVAPQLLDARKTLARLLLTQNRPDKVLELLDEASAEQAADPELQQLRSQARGVQLKATQTVDSLQAQLVKEPGKHELRLALAVAQISSGAPGDALQTLRGLPADFQAATQLRVKLLALIAQSNRRDLEREVDAVAKLDPPQVNQLLTAADVTAALGRSDLATRLLDIAQKAAPDNSTVALGRAAVLLVDRKIPEARQVLAELSQRDPRNVQAKAAQARVEMAAGDYGTARKLLADASAVDPTSSDIALMLAGLELRANRVDSAVTVLRSFVGKAKPDGAAAAASGQLLASSRRLQEAVPFLRQAQQQRKNPTDTLNLARVLSQTGGADEARQLLQAALRERPGDADAVVTLASIETSAGESQQAIQRLSGLSAGNQSRIDALVALGDAQAAQGKFAEANDSYGKAQQSAPSSALAIRLFGVRVRGSLKDPAAPLTDWLQRYPNDVTVKLALGDHYIRTNDRSAAVATYEIILLQPNQPAALNNLAWLLSETDGARAEELARKAVQLVPNQPQIAETLASILVRRGKHAEALPLFASAEKVIAQDGGALYRYALALKSTGDQDAARAMAVRALAAPGNFAERKAAEELAAALD
jgi:putative PEP-CTERM system TPR-repeat lipoprotein